MTTTVAPANPVFRPRGVFFGVATRTSLRLGAWVWAITLVVTAVVPFVIDHFGGEPMSIFSTAVQGPRWFGFVTGIIVVAGALGPTVAQGTTRRAFVRELGASSVVVAVIYGVAAAIVAAAEHWFHTQQGWALSSVYGGRPMPSGRWHLVALDHAVVLAVFALAGVAVGAVYYRWGGWAGTLTLPVTAGPVFVVSGLLSHVEPVELGNSLDTLPYPAGLALALAVGAALWAVAHLALRGAPVRAALQS